MSARNSLKEKKARRDRKIVRQEREAIRRLVVGDVGKVRHGVCRKCGHRKFIWVPANLCQRDLFSAHAVTLLTDIAQGRFAHSDLNYASQAELAQRDADYWAQIEAELERIELGG